MTEELVQHLKAISSQMKTAPAAQDNGDVVLDLTRADGLVERIGAALLKSNAGSDGQKQEVEYECETSIDMSTVVPRIFGSEIAELPTLPVLQ